MKKEVLAVVDMQKDFIDSALGTKEAEAIVENVADKITLIGLCTDICVISNAIMLKAFLTETEIAVVESCCAGVTPESHANALEAMKMCRINVE